MKWSKYGDQNFPNPRSVKNLQYTISSWLWRHCHFAVIVHACTFRAIIIIMRTFDRASNKMRIKINANLKLYIMAILELGLR